MILSKVWYTCHTYPLSIEQAKHIEQLIFPYIISFTSSEENNSLDKYYCVIRLNPLLKIRKLPVNVTFMSTPYYSIAIHIVRNCKNVNNFPIITSQNIYECIKKIETPLFGEKYSLFNWVKTWKNIASKFIHSDNRNILFKYLPKILPNNLRL